jgi:hypothetical protein
MSAWEQQGNIFLWRFRQAIGSYRGVHLTADAAGCVSLDELLTKFIDMPRHRRAVVRVTRPTEAILSVPGHGGGGVRWRSPEALQVVMRGEDSNPREWLFRPRGLRFELVAGRDRLVELRDAIRGIPEGRGDFAIGPDDDSEERGTWDETCLWIWWVPGTGAHDGGPRLTVRPVTARAPR